MAQTVSQPAVYASGLKDNNQALVARSGPEFNPRACPCVLQGPHHNTRCWFSIQYFIFLFYILPRDPHERLRSNKLLNRTVPCELCRRLHFLSLRHAKGPNIAPTACRVEISFNAFWHCRTMVTDDTHQTPQSPFTFKHLPNCGRKS